MCLGFIFHCKTKNQLIFSPNISLCDLVLRVTTKVDVVLVLLRSL
jgi:hypothetical protein